MAIADTYLDLVRGFEASKGKKPAKPGLFARFMLALKDSRRRQAERAIARHMHLVGEVQARADGAAAVDRKVLPF